MSAIRHTHGTGARAIDEAVLEDGDVRFSVLALGCRLRDWRVLHRGRRRSVVLGYADPLAYWQDPFFLGAVVGRVANRTRGGRFVLDGRTVHLTRNEGTTHLHGGPGGLFGRLWALETDDAATAVRLTYSSPDGEEGYPGSVAFAVTIRLNGGRLSYVLEGRPDRPTPINLAQHAYYNLASDGDVRDHALRIAALAHAVTDAEGLPTGVLAPVAGTRLDFGRFRTPREADPEARGLDDALVLDPARDPAAPVAEVRGPDGLDLRIWTDRSSLQLYDGCHMTRTPGGLDGAVHDRFSGLCLEAQALPDSLNQPGFPSILCTPEHPYRQVLTVDVSGTV